MAPNRRHLRPPDADREHIEMTRRVDELERNAVSPSGSQLGVIRAGTPGGAGNFIVRGGPSVVPELTVAVGAYETWWLEYRLLMSAATDTMDAQFGLSVPTNADAVGGPFVGNGVTAQGGLGWSATTSAPDPLMTEASLWPMGMQAGLLHAVAIDFWVFNQDEPGDVSIAVGQFVVEAADLSVRYGSVVRATRLHTFG